MTDQEIDAAISAHKVATEFHQAEIERLQAQRRARASPAVMPAPAAARKQPAASRPRYQSAQAAFRRFPFIQEHTVRRLCSDHPEWSRRFTNGGAWFVDADKFAAFADRVEAGEASFGMSEKSAVSVAADEQFAINFDQQPIHENEDVT